MSFSTKTHEKSGCHQNQGEKLIPSAAHPLAPCQPPWPPWNFKHRPPTPQASVLKMILFLIYGLFTEIKKGKKLLKMCNTIILVFLPEEYYCK